MSKPTTLKARLYDALFNNKLPEPDTSLTAEELSVDPEQVFDWVDTQLTSRLLDLHSRELQAMGESFYTIGSAGHEGNAAIASAFRPTDMAFLHYRSGAFFVQRQKQKAGSTPVYDMLLSFAASKFDPISSGRHKVLGSKELFVPPQTSTIASHLPKAVGMAHSIGLARRMGHQGEVPQDSVVLCSFGDASANHSTATGAINSACWAAYQNVPMPIVFVCEDNGIGISTATPRNWIEANYSNRPELHYICCDGRNPLDVYRASKQAERIARKRRKPVFLHMNCVRLYGHAGSDAEITYLSREQIEHNEQSDPLRFGLALLEHSGVASQKEMAAYYTALAERIEAVGKRVIQQPRLTSADQVMEHLAPQHPEKTIPAPAQGGAREELFYHDKRNLGKPQALSKSLNWALLDIMHQYRNTVMMGEDIGKKGGVYGVTGRLIQQFGPNRVVNTLLDEQSILGMAIGLAHNGLIPIPEIQFLAYVHNAEDQIRGEAATLQFFSSAKYSNPMVIRIAGLAYQKGFGGHFHNDNSIAVFRDLPGVVVVCPSNGADGARLLREAVRLADEQRRVVVFIEPIALYNQRDLMEAGDDGWVTDYPQPTERIAFGDVSYRGNGQSVCILSYGNGFYLSCQAQQELAAKRVNVRVVDLHWLHPLPVESVMKAIGNRENVLIVDECRESGSVSEELFTRLYEAGYTGKLARITAKDSFIPLAKAAYTVLPDKDSIVEKVLQMVEGES